MGAHLLGALFSCGSGIGGGGGLLLDSTVLWGESLSYIIGHVCIWQRGEGGEGEGDYVFRLRRRLQQRFVSWSFLFWCSGFPGEHWDSYHLDDLCAGDGDLVDIGHLQKRSVSEVLSDPDLMNAKALIKDCVHEAGSLIRDPTERKLERTKLFLHLLDENGTVCKWTIT